MELLGMTPEDLSYCTGIDQESIDYIIGNGFVSSETAERIAQAVGTKLTELVIADACDAGENIIEFIRDDPRATVTLSQRKYINRIRKLADKYPDSCQILAENTDGTIIAHIPTCWIKISPPRVMSPAQTEQALRNLDARNRGSISG